MLFLYFYILFVRNPIRSKDTVLSLLSQGNSQEVKVKTSHDKCWVQAKVVENTATSHIWKISLRPELECSNKELPDVWSPTTQAPLSPQLYYQRPLIELSFNWKFRQILEQTSVFAWCKPVGHWCQIWLSQSTNLGWKSKRRLKFKSGKTMIGTFYCITPKLVVSVLHLGFDWQRWYSSALSHNTVVVYKITFGETRQASSSHNQISLISLFLIDKLNQNYYKYWDGNDA